MFRKGEESNTLLLFIFKSSYASRILYGKWK